MKRPTLNVRGLFTAATVLLLAVATSIHAQGPTTSTCADSPTGIVSCWPAEGDASDAIGSNHGMAVGDTTYGTGKFGQAFVFDGSGDWVKTPQVISNWSEGTIETWVRFDTILNTPNQFIGSGTNGGGIDPIMMFGNWNGFGFGFCFDNTYPCTWQLVFTSVDPETSRWYHVAGTWGTEGMKMYIDGELMGSALYAGPSPATDYHMIGASYWDQVYGNLGIDGAVDELKIYNRALTTSEIRAECRLGGDNCGGLVYSICLLYDPMKAHKSGSVAPIKLQLCDVDGNNLSEPGVVLTATGVHRLLPPSPDMSAAQSAGKSNPSQEFRFDQTLGAGGGYIFNLKTTGLTSGTYELLFTTTGDSPSEHAAQFRVR